jgi:methionyl-tRNA formyltransferase
MTDNNYIVAGCKSWNRSCFDEVISGYDGHWSYVDDKEVLLKEIETLKPRYVFFLHWSWIVPKEVVDNYECVCFHMTDVPYGRGGSPLQNLIVRGHKDTKLTALRMVEELDAGPVYLKEELSLKGSAEEVYVRATELSADMIEKIIMDEPEPAPQEGEVVSFERRKPEQSEVPEPKDIEAFFDFIRMLDAEGYPKAFLTHKGFKVEFSSASFKDGKLSAGVEITKTEDKK